MEQIRGAPATTHSLREQMSEIMRRLLFVKCIIIDFMYHRSEHTRMNDTHEEQVSGRRTHLTRTAFMALCILRRRYRAGATCAK